MPNNPRRIELRFRPDEGRWHATSVINGAQYSVRGRNRNDVFLDLCRMLHMPADSWRIALIEPDRYQCTEIVREVPSLELPSTDEIKPLHAAAKKRPSPKPSRDIAP